MSVSSWSIMLIMQMQLWTLLTLLFKIKKMSNTKRLLRLVIWAWARNSWSDVIPAGPSSIKCFLHHWIQPHIDGSHRSCCAAIQQPKLLFSLTPTSPPPQPLAAPKFDGNAQNLLCSFYIANFYPLLITCVAPQSWNFFFDAFPMLHQSILVLVTIFRRDFSPSVRTSLNYDARQQTPLEKSDEC